jgi:signal transduction histidine kinase
MTDPADIESLREEIRRLRPLAELGRMAATVAHEVRNPLAGISANAELVREALRDPADVESIDIILTEVERLGRLVTDLLYYSRERDAANQPFDLSTLARNTCDLSMSDASRLGVGLSWSGSGMAVGDIDLSRQALLNVVRNAVEACRPGGAVKIEVTPGQVIVRDQGGGVPENLREKLFEPFVSGKTRGLGLGATVAKRCLLRQRGDLVLSESSAAGSVFAMRWPVP